MQKDIYVENIYDMQKSLKWRQITNWQPYIVSTIALCLFQSCMAILIACYHLHHLRLSLIGLGSRRHQGSSLMDPFPGIWKLSLEIKFNLEIFFVVCLCLVLNILAQRAAGYIEKAPHPEITGPKKACFFHDKHR